MSERQPGQHDRAKSRPERSPVRGGADVGSEHEDAKYRDRPSDDGKHGDAANEPNEGSSRD